MKPEMIKYVRVVSVHLDGWYIDEQQNCDAGDLVRVDYGCAMDQIAEVVDIRWNMPHEPKPYHGRIKPVLEIEEKFYHRPEYADASKKGRMYEWKNQPIRDE